MKNVKRTALFATSLLVLLSACGGWPGKRVAGVTKMSEFPTRQTGRFFALPDNFRTFSSAGPAQVVAARVVFPAGTGERLAAGRFFASLDNFRTSLSEGAAARQEKDNTIYDFRPYEPIEFHATGGDTVLLYTDLAHGLVASAHDARYWWVDKLFFFKDGVYQQESDYLTIVSVDERLHIARTVEVIVAIVGGPLREFDKTMTTRTNLSVGERVFLFRLKDDYLLVSAHSDGRIIGFRQGTPGVRPSRARLQQVNPQVASLPFWQNSLGF